MAGNLGSSKRLEFTVIGVSVIVACRLEHLTRQFPDMSILISRAPGGLWPAGIALTAPSAGGTVP